MKPLLLSPTGGPTLGPVPGSEFHNDRHDHLHGGIDLNCPRIPLIAGESGIILMTGLSSGLGGNKLEMITDTLCDGQHHLLKHYHFGHKHEPWQDCIYVRAGQRVKRGQQLGVAGDSGNASAVHDHYEHWIGSRQIDPLQHLKEYQVIRRFIPKLRLALAYPKAEGPDIPLLQTRLTAHGHYCQSDGIYGPRTLRAVLAFQSSKGLRVDGIVGRDTWRALLRQPTL